MLAVITDYAVPAGLFVLMLIVGTDLRTADFRRTLQYPVIVLAAVSGQLLLLPLLALLIVAAIKLQASLAAAIIVLALCPGGAISNYYCYLARSNVALSTTITAVTTIASLFSIPLWLVSLRHGGLLLDAPPRVPATVIFLQLLFLMVVPLGTGMIARRLIRDLDRYQNALAWVSLLVVGLTLVSATWALRDDLLNNAAGVLPAAALFTFGAMLLGWALARGTKTNDEPVFVIECAARNIGVAVLVGSAQVPEPLLGVFFAFLTGYFIIEMVIMLTYARRVRAKAEGTS